MTSTITDLVFVAVAAAIGCIGLLISARRMRSKLLLRRRLGQLATRDKSLDLVRRGGEDDANSIAAVLAQSGLGWDLSALVSRAGLAAGGGLFVGLLLGSGPVAVIFGLLGVIGVWLFIRHAAARRLAKCDEQMPQALEIMSLALRAGHALPSALALAAEEAPSPISDELRRATDEHSLGRPVAQVLEAMGRRLPGCEAVNTFVVAVLVLQETGGNLISVIDRIVDNARAVSAYKSRLKALTAEGRTSAKLLAALPVGFAVLAGAMDANYSGFFLHDTTGQIIGVCACLWWLLGVTVTRRMIALAS